MALVVSRTGSWTLQIVKRSTATGFEVLPKRWIVERTFAWISRNRRLARFRTLRHHRRCVCSSRHDPHHAPTTRNRLVMNPNFPDGLLHFPFCLPGQCRNAVI